jgi:hypothetical protein
MHVDCATLNAPTDGNGTVGSESNEPSRLVTLSPSSLTFDWAECRCCWWHLYVAKDRKKLRQPLPKIFTLIDSAVKMCFSGQPASLMIPGADGRIESGRAVRSAGFVPTGCKSTIRFNGRTDFVAAFVDGTYGVPDAKTAEVKDEHVEFYSRQLHAYAYCLAHPDPAKNAAEPVEVSRLGLYVFQPGSFWVDPESGQAALRGNSCWQEIALDMDAFMAFMSEVGQVVDSPVAPSANPACVFCNEQAGAGERHEAF